MIAACPAGPAVTFRSRVVGEMLFEDDALGRQLIQVRRFNPLVAVTTEVAGVQGRGVEDEYFHRRNLPPPRWLNQARPHNSEPDGDFLPPR